MQGPAPWPVGAVLSLPCVLGMLCMLGVLCAQCALACRTCCRSAGSCCKRAAPLSAYSSHALTWQCKAQLACCPCISTLPAFVVRHACHAAVAQRALPALRSLLCHEQRASCTLSANPPTRGLLVHSGGCMHDSQRSDRRRQPMDCGVVAIDSPVFCLHLPTRLLRAVYCLSSYCCTLVFPLATE